MSLSLAVDCRMVLGSEHTKVNGVRIMLLKYTLLLLISFLMLSVPFSQFAQQNQREGGGWQKGLALFQKLMKSTLTEFFLMLQSVHHM